MRILQILFDIDLKFPSKYFETHLNLPSNTFGPFLVFFRKLQHFVNEILNLN